MSFWDSYCRTTSYAPSYPDHNIQHPDHHQPPSVWSHAAYTGEWLSQANCLKGIAVHFGAPFQNQRLLPIPHQGPGITAVKGGWLFIAIKVRMNLFRWSCMDLYGLSYFITASKALPLQLEIIIIMNKSILTLLFDTICLPCLFDTIWGFLSNLHQDTRCRRTRCAPDSCAASAGSAALWRSVPRRPRRCPCRGPRGASAT